MPSSSNKKKQRGKNRRGQQQTVSVVCPHAPITIPMNPQIIEHGFRFMHSTETLAQVYEEISYTTSRREQMHILITLLESPEELKNEVFLKRMQNSAIYDGVEFLVLILKHLDVAKIRTFSNAELLDKAKKLREALQNENSTKAHSLLWTYMAELFGSKARKGMRKLRDFERPSLGDLTIFFSKHSKCGCLDEKKKLYESQPKMSICDYCAKQIPVMQLRHCAGCGISRFCSEECHKDGWNKAGHKVSCKIIQETGESG